MNQKKPAKPNPKMLGTGMAQKAGSAVRNAQVKKKRRLGGIMDGLRSGRR